MTTRKASHAGSWYSADPIKLSAQIDSWLAAARAKAALEDRGDGTVKGVRSVVAPHAGLSYSGETAAFAYASVDPSSIKRIFVLGPSHRFYLGNCALSKCAVYDTPLGPVEVDVQVVQELREKGKSLFRDLSLRQDEEEHCVEMHLPFIRKLFPGVKIVPVLVGSVGFEKEVEYGSILAPYFADPSTLVAISTDFCHWGSRFGYTYYLPLSGSPRHLSASKKEDGGKAVWRSIRELDREGMDIWGGLGEKKGAGEVHRAFEEYLERTENTICGRHSLGVLLGALTHLQTTSVAGEEERGGKREVEVEWVKYEMSERVEDWRGSSVSYAGGWIKF